MSLTVCLIFIYSPPLCSSLQWLSCGAVFSCCIFSSLCLWLSVKGTDSFKPLTVYLVVYSCYKILDSTSILYDLLIVWKSSFELFGIYVSTLRIYVSAKEWIRLWTEENPLYKGYPDFGLSRGLGNITCPSRKLYNKSRYDLRTRTRLNGTHGYCL